MEKAHGENYYQKIQSGLKRGRSVEIDIELLNIPEIHLEAFWFLMNAGYPTKFVLMNYINLYEYANKNSIDYKRALKVLYSVYPGLYTGVCIRELKMFELN